MNKAALAVALSLLCLPAFSQPAPCSCAADFSKLEEKLEANYVAYHLHRADIDEGYQEHKQRYAKLVQTTRISDCARVLQSFLEFFKDGHLFAAEFPNYAEPELQAFRKQVQTGKLDTRMVKKYLVKNRQRLSSIEGLWTDGSSRFAIIRNPVRHKFHEFIAVVLDAPDPTQAGEIKLRLAKGMKHYEGTYYTNTYAPRYVTADLYKDDSLLYLTGGIYWGRLSGVTAGSIETAPLYVPGAPSLRLAGEKYAIISLPSFLIDGKFLDAFLMDNLQTLSNVPYWIIDLRGNIGGNGIYFNLMSGYYERPVKAEDPGFAIASQDNFEYFSGFGTGTASPHAPVAAAMKDHMGELVRGPRFGDLVLGAQPTKLKRVIILTDRSNMSAAETFVLLSKGISSKVITMGENTGGVVDYNDINMVGLDCASQNIRFGYPTYSRNASAHKEGYNNIGIPPDIPIDQNVKDKIAFAIDYLQRQ